MFNPIILHRTSFAEKPVKVVNNEVFIYYIASIQVQEDHMLRMLLLNIRL